MGSSRTTHRRLLRNRFRDRLQQSIFIVELQLQGLRNRVSHIENKSDQCSKSTIGNPTSDLDTSICRESFLAMRKVDTGSDYSCEISCHLKTEYVMSVTPLADSTGMDMQSQNIDWDSAYFNLTEEDLGDELLIADHAVQDEVSEFVNGQCDDGHLDIEAKVKIAQKAAEFRSDTKVIRLPSWNSVLTSATETLVSPASVGPSMAATCRRAEEVIQVNAGEKSIGPHNVSWFADSSCNNSSPSDSEDDSRSSNDETEEKGSFWTSGHVAFEDLDEQMQLYLREVWSMARDMPSNTQNMQSSFIFQAIIGLAKRNKIPRAKLHKALDFLESSLRVSLREAVPFMCQHCKELYKTNVSTCLKCDVSHIVETNLCSLFARTKDGVSSFG